MASNDVAMETTEKSHQWLLNSSFPVLVPEMPHLLSNKAEFDGYVKSLVPPQKDDEIELPVRAKGGRALENAIEILGSEGDAPAAQVAPSPFMESLLAGKTTDRSIPVGDGKMLTENGDPAYADSGEALVNLFYELEDKVSADRLKKILKEAWATDSEATLRIIWNARSIHLGKSRRTVFYRAVGWLAEFHPLTMLTNLPWLVRPVIPKKAPKKAEGMEEDADMVDAKDADSDFEMVDDTPELDGQPDLKKVKRDEADAFSEFDIKYGVAHGYWKDLANMLALAINGQLRVDGDVRSVLNVEKPKDKKYKRDWTAGKKKEQTKERHERTMKMLRKDGFYKAFHMSVARLFAMQLKTDIAALKSGDKKAMKQISLAAKWTPSHGGMHDQHTFITSTIAELVHPPNSVSTPGVDPADRAAHLKLARASLQDCTLSPLRKHLAIVERPIAANKFGEIKYDRVPSLAMQQYAPLFMKKDEARFDSYIDSVSAGGAKISGAILLPSNLANVVQSSPNAASKTSGKTAKALVEQKRKETQYKMADGQWKTLVQRIKDSGTLESAIAVVDVSGSMNGPRFADGTSPMDSAIGLGLLISDITAAPFGGAFITFSDTPQVVRVGGDNDKRSFKDKVHTIAESQWSMNTDFAAVFEQLILPMAVENKLKQEDMVKNVFVFSDMHFDRAGGRDNRWESSFERIQEKFKDAGYEMPKLIFWNLAGGQREGYVEDPATGNYVAPKPVTAAQENTVLVGGYSQGQMKMFLDGGGFDEPEGEEVVEDRDSGGEDGEGEVVVEKRKKKQDPLAAVLKAISHDSYRMLEVVD